MQTPRTRIASASSTFARHARPYGLVALSCITASCGGSGTVPEDGALPADATSMHDVTRMADTSVPDGDTADAGESDTGSMRDVPTAPDAIAHMDVATHPDVPVVHDAGPAPTYTSALAHLFAMTPAEQHAVFTTHGSLGIEGCNAVSYAQVPGSPHNFLGRSLNTGTCAGTAWRLTTNSLVAGPALHTTGILFDPAPPHAGVPASGDTITTAYDTSTALFAGHIWVAFECAGPGIVSAGSCVAPLDASGTHLDTSGLRVVVSGNGAGIDPGYNHSASVPKLLVHAGHLYLYWSSVRMRASDGVWADIRTRGVELAVVSNHVQAVGSSGPLAADDAVEVWGLGTDARSNAVADTFQFISDGGYVYALAALGGGACRAPTTAAVGCYRLAIARATTPLGLHAFNALDPAHRIPDAVLPANPMEYPRIYTNVDGSVVMSAHVLGMPTSGGAVLHDGTKLELPASASLMTFAMPSGPAGCPAGHDAPDWGMRDGVCRASCGGIGGTASAFNACSLNGHTDVGTAYDVPFCCH